MILRPYHTRGYIEAGCDEAGRGCLAGPVYAAAVVLPADVPGNLACVLKDSKKLTAGKRDKISEIIKQEAVSWAIASVDNACIDKINILNAAIHAMHKALDKLTVMPGKIIVDGNRFKQYRDITHTCVVKGDTIYMSVAAASILAKTHRDKKMISLHNEFPQYKWDVNKGYPTREHRDMVRVYGISNYHRRSFRVTI